MAARLDGGDDGADELHEINVTPFIDVMLVLLIIFMVAAPLSTVDVAVDLPVSTTKPQPRPDKPLFLTIKADQSLALGNDAIPPAQLAQAIDAATSADRTQRIFLRADKTVPYGGVDAGDEPAARGGLSQGGAGRPGRQRRRHARCRPNPEQAPSRRRPPIRRRSP